MSCDGIVRAAAELRQALLDVDTAMKRQASAKAAYDTAIIAQLLWGAI